MNNQAQEVKKEVQKDLKAQRKKVGKKIKALYGPKLHQYFKSVNPYLAAILDPWNIHGVRIPDWNTQASTTFAISFRANFTTNATGCGYLTLGRGITNASADLASLIPIGHNATGTDYRIGFYNIDPLCTPNNLYANGGTIPPTIMRYDNWNASNSAVPGAFSKVRLVSAGLSTTVQCSLANSQGKISMVSLPRWKTQNENALFTLAYLESQPGCRIVDINKIDGCSAIYTPLDPVSLEYCDLTRAMASSTDIKAYECFAGGEFHVAVSGAAANVVVQCVFVANFEAIPKFNTFNLASPSPSPSDFMSLQSAFNYVQKVPDTYVGTQQAMGVISGQHLPVSTNNTGYSNEAGTHAQLQNKQSSNPWGSLGSVLEALPGFMDKATSVGENLVPVVESLAALL
jgi:hypothetical protein